MKLKVLALGVALSLTLWGVLIGTGLIIYRLLEVM